MHRRRVLSLVAAAPLVAGCSTGPAAENGSVRPSSEGVGVLGSREPPPRDELLSKPRPPAEEPIDATEDTVAALQYPTKPTSYTGQSVRSFVENCERAYSRNEVLGRYGGDLVAHRFDSDWAVALDASGDAGVGRCQYSYATTEISDRTDDAGPVVGDSGTYVVTYYVDDSVVVRAEGTGPTERRDELAPDPWESGVVLEAGGWP